MSDTSLSVSEVLVRWSRENLVLVSSFSLREKWIPAPIRLTLHSTLNTAKKNEEEEEEKKKQTATEKGKRMGHRESYQQGWLVKKGGRRLETENLLFPQLVSCRDCEVNGFEMKWVYELVARSQEARSSDCFVNSDSLKFLG